MSESSEDAQAPEEPGSDSDAEDDGADEMAALRQQVEEKYDFCRVSIYVV